MRDCVNMVLYEWIIMGTKMFSYVCEYDVRKKLIICLWYDMSVNYVYVMW